MIYELVNGDFGKILFGTDENGKVWTIPMDESNSDYQAYLNKDKQQVEHLTEIIPSE